MINIKPDGGHVGFCQNVGPIVCPSCKPYCIINLWAKFGVFWRIWTKQSLYCSNTPDYRSLISLLSPTYKTIFASQSVGLISGTTVKLCYKDHHLVWGKMVFIVGRSYYWIKIKKNSMKWVFIMVVLICIVILYEFYPHTAFLLCDTILQ